MDLILPKNYDAKLSAYENQAAIRFIRENFQEKLGEALNLSRLSAPMFVEKSTGLNDNLNGFEKAVSFDSQDLPDKTIEIVHSLAKWKRMALKKYNFKMHEGLYTNMNAIRKDEDLDNYHSIYVDQWDWEKIIQKDERNVDTLKQTVQKIYGAIKEVSKMVQAKYPEVAYPIPDEITFVTTQELEDRWPDLTPMERENAIAKENGAVFLMQIGGTMRSGERHDGRAPDYDDWKLNGDIIFWYEPLQNRLELSSMGIRVDEITMKDQLAELDSMERTSLPFHQDLLNGKLPYTIGGGIGQSRLCVLLLGKAHIGEVQSSIWPDEMIEKCAEDNVHLM